MDRPLFAYDLGSRYAWLAAQRVDALVHPAPEWLPVLLGGLFAARGRRSWGTTDERTAGMADFAEGRPPGDPASIRLAAQRAGLDGDALLAARDEPEVKAALRGNTDRALALGAIGVPTVIVGGRSFWGDDHLEEAAAAAAAA